MLRTIERTGYTLLAGLLLVISISSFMKWDGRSQIANLHVPFVPQCADSWCWAAVTSMVLQYEHQQGRDVPPLNQCQYVRTLLIDNNDTAFYSSRNWLSLLDTFPLSPYGASIFANQTGLPFCDSLGHTFTTTTGMTSAQGALPLPYDTLCAEFAAGRPVIFGWFWTAITENDVDSTGAHWLVACGAPHSSYFNGHFGYVLVNDPWPTGRGKHRIMLYPEYANHLLMDENGAPLYAVSKHYQDYYHISYSGK